ncbi:MAG: O-methyltransferase [Guyparkeria sp.]
MNPYSVSSETARVLANLVLREGCTRVLEFGAGVSSVVFAAVLEARGGGSLTSLEQNPEWCRDLWARVERAAGVEATLIASDIGVTIDPRGVFYGWKARDEIRRHGPFDLVFVDAPWVDYGRDGSLHACADRIRPGGWVVLDDAARKKERRVLRRWLAGYPGFRLVALDDRVGRGVAVLRKFESGRRPAWHRRVGLWLDGLYDMARSVRSVRRHERERPERVPDAG